MRNYAAWCDAVIFYVYNDIMKYHFGQFTPDHLALLEEGIELFNKRHYWMCHEVVEDLWMDHIDYLWGLAVTKQMILSTKGSNMTFG